MTMMKVRLFLEKLNGWQRSWCLVSLTWLISCIIVTTYSIPFPTENEMSSGPVYSVDEILNNTNENIESAKAACHAKEIAAGITTDLECLKHVDQMEQRHSQNISDATSRIQAAAKENLLLSQISVVEKGAAVAIFPILGLYLFGMGLAWVRRGFTKTEGTGESVDN